VVSGRSPDRQVEHPLSLQRWEDLTFLHWHVPPATIQEVLPPGLVVDTFDGQAWLGVTPFRMHARPAYGPTVPRLSTFPEVNLRTYVRGPDGGDGVWFFSLECPRVPVVLAMRAIGVPYVRADAEIRTGPGHDHLHYRTRRRSSGVGMHASVETGDPIEPEPLTDFLTGRWSAYLRRFGRLWRIDVDHEPWPLRSARARTAVAALLAAAGLPEVTGEPLAHFSPGVATRVGRPVPVGGRRRGHGDA
jgi:uncharacterized protein